MTITDIINVERKLLKLEDEHRFEMSLDELITLKTELERISKITSLYFDIQYDFSQNVTDDEESLSIYHDSLTNCELNVNIKDAINIADTMEAKFSR
jgi:hypothetical protein